MSVAAISKVVTANDLKSGEVLYLRFPHSWTPELAKASVIKDNDLAKASLAFVQGQPNTVVGAYLSDVIDERDGPRASHFRERFRSTGPSNYRHGKQEL
jgi:hypothetical protein